MVFYQSRSLSIKAVICVVSDPCFSITRLEVFFSPDHNQAPISSYCSGWKAISCSPADVLWDMNDLIKSHAKGREMKAGPRALAPFRQEMRRSVWVNGSKHTLASGLGSVFHVLVFLDVSGVPEAPSLHIIKWDRPPYLCDSDTLNTTPRCK